MNKIGIALRGMAMGIAEIIPGVSGGTIAFITGIYKELLDTINGVNASLIKNLVRMEWGKVWQGLNGPFLFSLIVGMGLGVLVGVFGVTHLLESHPEALWGLFFGLILASVPYMLSQMNEKKAVHLILFFLGAAIAYFITSLSPSEGSDNYLYIFLAGVIAISALVLPGISGSFMLLLMGLYTTIIPTIKAFLDSPELSEFLLLAVFGLGCIVGLLSFSRLVSMAFEKYYNGTIALMAGFMLGSLNKIWPWRNPTRVLDKDKNQFLDITQSNSTLIDLKSESIKIIDESNVLPAAYHSDANTVFVMLSFVAGLLAVYFLSRYGER